MSDGPFTDDHAKHWMMAVQTHDGIIKYAEAMAQVLAEAGRASAKVTGDSPRTAINKWADIIRNRAHELVKPSPMEDELRKRLRQQRLLAGGD